MAQQDVAAAARHDGSNPEAGENVAVRDISEDCPADELAPGDQYSVWSTAQTTTS